MSKQAVAYNKTWLNYKDYEPTSNRVVIIALVNNSGDVYDTYAIYYNKIEVDGLYTNAYWIDFPNINIDNSTNK